MSESTHGTAAKIFVWFWYLPIIVILAVTGYVSFDKSAPAGIVDKARVFQDSQEASQPLEALGKEKFDFKLALNQEFSVAGVGVKGKGSFRDGQRMEVPLTVEGLPGKAVTSVRAQLLDGKEQGLLPGMLVTVRSCETAWEESPSGYVCAGANKIEQSTTPVTVDTFPIMDADEKLAPTAKKFLLFQFTVEKDIIVPVEGYETKLQLLTTGLTEPAKG